MKALTSWVSVLTPGDGDPRHGYHGYSNLGCRCEVCRAAKATYMREKRAAAPISLYVAGIKHGTAGYKDHKCRCAVCREANRASDPRQRRAS